MLEQITENHSHYRLDRLIFEIEIDAIIATCRRAWLGHRHHLYKLAGTDAEFRSAARLMRRIGWGSVGGQWLRHRLSDAFERFLQGGIPLNRNVDTRGELQHSQQKQVTW
ncbi:hypothetical protein GCM10007863_24570 [Dyella mobilis]|nr:hypothetical protein GCM10007863_24570 [Dyella mobilis]